MEFPIHPVFVHFPVALLLAAFAMEIVGLALKREKIRAAAYPTLIMAVLGAAAAVATGLYGEDQLGKVAAELHELIERHELMAYLTLGFSATALALRFWAEKKDALGEIWGKLSTAALALAVIFVLAAGYFGGEIVYRHGAGTSFYNSAHQDAPFHKNAN